jgi:oxalate---CoA ligase
VDTLLSILETQARAHATRPAILDATNQMLTYAELFARVQTIARALAALGVQRGDRVAIVLPNGPDAALSFLGVAAVAAAAPLNTAYSRDEFAFYFGDLQTKLAVVDAAAAPAAVEAAQAMGVRLTSLPPLVAGVVDPGPASARPATAGSPVSDDVALVLHTSGTTSRPKIVPLTHGNLACNAQNIARSLELTPDDRCLNVMPLFHVHGLVGAVLGSLAAGASVVCTPGFNAAQFFGWLRHFSPTWYTAVPTMHQAALARAIGDGGVPKSSLRFIRSCSSALPPKLMGELEAAFSVPVIEALGMTEASHQVASNPLPPRARKPGSVGVATGPEVAIMDEAGALLPRGAAGEIVLRGPNVTRGYTSPPEANAKAFTQGWFRTGDQGTLDADGYLFLTGRLKEIINRGGEKVSPREVDEALLEHPAVAQAVAFAVPHATLGEDVGAAVVLRTGAAAAGGVTGDAIREFTFTRLAAFKVPSVVLVVDAIPKGPTGKLQRIGLVEKLRDRLATAYVAPRDDIESLVADTWQEVLGREKIGVHDNFFVLGGDSLRGARAMARLNNLFATELPVSTAFRQPTVEQLARQVRAAAAPARLAEIAAMLAEVRAMTEEEARRALGER